MKKSIVTRGYSDGRNRVELDLSLQGEGLPVEAYNFKCSKSELEDLIKRQIEQNSKISDVIVHKYVLSDKELPSYHLDHIEIRYFLSRHFCPYDLLDVFYQTERDISIIYSNFLKSLKPPFNQE